MTYYLQFTIPLSEPEFEVMGTFLAVRDNYGWATASDVGDILTGEFGSSMRSVEDIKKVLEKMYNRGYLVKRDMGGEHVRRGNEECYALHGVLPKNILVGFSREIEGATES